MHTLPGSSQFPTKRWTRWSPLAIPIGRKPDQLWPLCARTTSIRCTPCLRRCGYAADQAHDLTQDFFIRVLERYRDLFRQEIADTMANPSKVEPELRFLAGTRK